jgi:hypothetical protein
MTGIWQIVLGTLIAVWEFIQSNHGFYQRQVRYHDYNFSGTIVKINVVVAVIYLISAFLIVRGIYRLTASRPSLKLRHLHQ